MDTLHITPKEMHSKAVSVWRDGAKVREFASYTECAAFLGCARSMVTRALRREAEIKGYELKNDGGDIDRFI